MIGPGNVLRLLERVVYGGVELVARLAPVTDDDGRRDSLLDHALDAPN